MSTPRPREDERKTYERPHVLIVTDDPSLIEFLGERAYGCAAPVSRTGACAWALGSQLQSLLSPLAPRLGLGEAELRNGE